MQKNANHQTNAAIGVVLSIALATIAYVTQFTDIRWMLAAGAVAALYAVELADWDLLASLLIVFPAYAAGFTAMFKVLAYQHHRVDAFLARLDHGTYLAVWQWCSARHWTNLILIPVYYGMGAVIVATLVVSKRRSEFMLAMLLSGIGATIIYWLVPAVGPAWVRLSQENLPNGFPSMHFGIALLCWLYASRFRWLFLMFTILTAAATLGLGEHYAVDLLVAVPFMFAMSFAASFLCNRKKSAMPLVRLTAKLNHVR